MPYFILGITILIGAMLVARWFINAEPSSIVKALRCITIIAIVAIAAFFAFTGRISWSLFALPALLPWFMRARSLARVAKNWSRMTGAGGGYGGQGGPADQSSEVETCYLKVYLDHGSGEMSGEVLQGQFAGKTLRNLSFDELLKLLAECASDEQSVQVISTYLDRYHGDEWLEEEAVGTGATVSGQMDVKEALEILGLEPGVSEEEIKSAHHRLMSKIHPDHGGSTYLATRINQAKDVLLNQS